MNVTVRMLLAAVAAFTLSAAPKPDKTKAAAYSALPLSFEVNLGQAEPTARFVWHRDGCSLALTPSGAVLRVEDESLRMHLAGARRSAEVDGVDPLPGKVNYFLGNDPTLWRANIPTYSRVRYRGVYPGIDLIYYGKDKQLEYDFIVAAGADPDQIRLTFEGAESLQVDSAGDLRFRMRKAEVRLRKPVVYQQTSSGRRVIDARYSLSGDTQVAFHVAAYDAAQPLVVDPVLDFASYLGGSGAEMGTAVALDAAGNVYLAGSTSNLPGFPLLNPLPGSSNYKGAFVAKLNPSGSALIYSTYLGDSLGRTSASGIAVDSSGNVYVTGTTASTDFPTTKGAFQPNYGGGSDIWGFYPNSDAFVTKLNASGSAIVYSSYLGGSGNDAGFAIAVDTAGNAFVAGRMDPNPAGPYAASDHSNAFVTKINPAGSTLLYTAKLGGGREDWATAVAVDPQGNAYATGITYSPNFPTQNAFQPHAAVSVVYRSDDGGKAWETSENGLITGVSLLVIDPQTTSTLYATGDRGLYKSVDSGDTWKSINNGIENPRISALVIDPNRPSTLYAVASAGGLLDPPAAVYKTTNGGASWTNTAIPQTNLQAPLFNPITLAIDPTDSNTIYLAAVQGAFKTIDGGSHWNATGLSGDVGRLAIDPQKPSTLYAVSEAYDSNIRRVLLLKTVDGGDNWSTLALTPGNTENIIVDPTDSATIYVNSTAGVAKSVDGGATWKVVLPSAWLLALAGGGPSAVLYASGLNGNLISRNAGDSWAPTGFRQDLSIQSLVVDPSQSEKLYAGMASGGAQAFVAKVSPAGGILYSTYLGGSVSNEGHAIAADAQGNAYITGWTNSPDFPGAASDRILRDDPGEVFVLKLNPAGTQLVYSTILGGGGVDIGQAIAVDAGGNAYVTGYTQSADFPTIGAVQSSAGGPRLLQSTDGGARWSSASKGLNSSDLRTVAADGTSPALYAGGNRGVSVSRDGGATWTATSLTSPTSLLAIDPRAPSTVYAAGGFSPNPTYRYFAGAGISKSTDGGQTWRPINTGLTGLDVRALVVHPENPSTVYCATDVDIFKTTDGGQSWTPTGPGGGGIFALAIDPASPAKLFAIRYGVANTDVVASDDAGATWKNILRQSDYYSPYDGGSALVVDPRGSSTIHALIWGEVQTTNDGGANWRSIQPDAGCTLYTLTAVPETPSALYAGGANYNGRSCVLKTADGGASWVNQYDGGIGVSALAVSQFQPGTIYAAMNPGANAFLTKLGPDGATVVYSTYLGGARDDRANAIAVDASGTAWVAGTTTSGDFPLAHPLQPRFGGDNGDTLPYPGGDVFVVKLREQ